MQPDTGTTRTAVELKPGSVTSDLLGRGQPTWVFSTSDAKLLADCRRGDGQAWDQLVSRYERLVFGVALRSGLDRDDAADATQSTFVALLDSIDDLREGHRLVTWLVTVARRCAWRIRKQRDRQPTAPVQSTGLDHQLADPVGDWERSDWVHAGLQRLEEPCRGLLIALYLDPAEPTYAEVAARLRRPVGSIGPTRARCLERLRHVLDESDR